MMDRNDRVIAAFDALVRAIQSADITLQRQQCIMAALSPADRDKSLNELNGFSDALYRSSREPLRLDVRADHLSGAAQPSEK